MNVLTVRPAGGPLDAVVDIPGSKSITNRALIVAALADGESTLRGALLADDTMRMIEALQSLGVSVVVNADASTVVVLGCRGQIPATQASLHCGNSGTTIRFCAALAALGYGEYTLDGVPRMRERPIGGLVDALRCAGAGVEYLDREGFPPIHIHAQGLDGGEVVFDDPPSSQMVSALLMAAPYARLDVMIEIKGQVVSAPYIRMTEQTMRSFGVEVISRYDADGARFVVAASQRFAARQFAIEPDASNASYFLAAPAVAGGHVTVRGLGADSTQGDVHFVDVLERMGCRIDRGPAELTVHGPAGGERLRGIDIDLNDMPDMAQTLAVVALFAIGPTRIRNVANLRVKETDRLAALAAELDRFGATVEIHGDGLTVHPPGRPAAAIVHTYQDHRMAMSFALAGLALDGVVIRDPACVGKTFPDFFDRWSELTAPG